jgi:hypothetical protein
VAPQTSLNGRVEHEICSLVALGVPFMTAARLAHVNPRTARDWYVLGGASDAAEHWRRFRESVDVARVEHAQAVAGRLAELRDVQLRPQSVRLGR